MNTLSNDIRDLLDEKPGTIDRMRKWVDAQLVHCSGTIIRYDNTIEKSMEIVRGLYNDDLSVILFVAPTQFGKTSTIFWAAHNLMTHIDRKYFVPYPQVFIMTGLNSNAWKDQTRARVLPCMQENVWHNKDVCKSENRERLKDAVLSNYNTLIIIDEVHVGTKLDHVIFNSLLEFHPERSERDISQDELFQFLHARKVKFILVSATPDAIKETMEQNWLPEKFRVIMANPNAAPTYVWHKDFLDHNRVHQAYRMEDDVIQSTKEVIQSTDEDKYDRDFTHPHMKRDRGKRPFHDIIAEQIAKYPRPMYHMIRFPMDTKKAEIKKSRHLLERSIQTKQIDAHVVLWDAKNTIRDYIIKNNFDVFEGGREEKREEEEEEEQEEEEKEEGRKKCTPSCASSKARLLQMSNEDILRERPIRHTIFILKEHFRVAQTMPIDNIGILVDRDTKTPCDSTLSQSLIGRACGHNKSNFINQIHIYTHVQSVKNYIALWENDFDYIKVPGYKGSGLKTTKTGSCVKTNETMMGEKVKRTRRRKGNREAGAGEAKEAKEQRRGSVSSSIEMKEKEKDKEEEKEKDDHLDQNDTPGRLAKIAKAYLKKNTNVYKIIQMFVERNFQPVKILNTKNPDNYNKYVGGKHQKFRIVEKVDGTWRLRSIIKEHLHL